MQSRMAGHTHDRNYTELQVTEGRIDSEALTLSKMILYPLIIPLAVIGKYS